MNRQPLVSICSITYNHASYIRQCLDGMLMQQTDFTFEIIINDDCSTDGTTEIIREYAERYPEIVKPIFHEENLYQKGQRGFFARFVFPKAQGKYIALCEGDDYWTDPLKLQKQVEFLESHPDYSLCFHEALVKWQKGERPDILFSNANKIDYYQDGNNIVSGIDIFKKWTIPTASAVLRREVFQSDVYKKAIRCEKFCFGDIVFFLSAAHIGKLYRFSDVMSVYRKHEGGVIYSYSYNKRVAQIEHTMSVPIVFGKKYLAISKDIVTGLCVNFSIFMFNIKKYNEAYNLFIIGFKYSPSGMIKHFTSRIIKYIKKKI